MKYIIQDRIGIYFGYYVFDKNHITRTLHSAKQFKTYIDALKFVYSARWCSGYKIVKVSNKELFKARLANV